MHHNQHQVLKQRRALSSKICAMPASKIARRIRSSKLFPKGIFSACLPFHVFCHELGVVGFFLRFFLGAAIPSTTFYLFTGWWLKSMNLIFCSSIQRQRYELKQIVRERKPLWQRWFWSEEVLNADLFYRLWYNEAFLQFWNCTFWYQRRAFFL